MDFEFRAIQAGIAGEMQGTGVDIDVVIVVVLIGMPQKDPTEGSKQAVKREKGRGHTMVGHTMAPERAIP